MSDTTTAPATTEAPAGKLTDSAMGEATEVAAATPPVTDAAPPIAAETINIETQKSAAQFAALSRREKALRQQERQMARQIKELEDRSKAMETSTADVTKYIDVESFKRNPYKYMKDHGLTLEQVAEIALNDGKITPEKLMAQSESKMEAKIKELENRLEQKEAKEQEERYDQVLQNFTANLTNFVNDTPDYEMIRAQDSDGVHLVYDVIDTHYNTQLQEFAEENGRNATHDERQEFILSNKQACDMVEKYLLDQEKARITKLRALNKTKGLFEPEKPKVEQKVKSPNSTTLTNTLSAQVPSKDSKTLTDEESKREAAKLIRWET